MFYTDIELVLRTYFNKVDKVTMLNSIESRVPFLDNDLSYFAMSLPSSLKVKGKEKKYLLRKALKDFIPDEILNGKKRGFETPLGKWFQHDLFDYAMSKYEQAKANYPFINAEYLIALLKKQRSGKATHIMILWKSLVLITWLDIYRDKIKIN
jgi:asparagine synthase (glutamine-hydrolysing)